MVLHDDVYVTLIVSIVKSKKHFVIIFRLTISDVILLFIFNHHKKKNASGLKRNKRTSKRGERNVFTVKITTRGKFTTPGKVQRFQ